MEAFVKNAVLSIENMLSLMHGLILGNHPSHDMAKINEKEFIKRGLSHGLTNQKKRCRAEIKAIAQRKQAAAAAAPTASSLRTFPPFPHRSDGTCAADPMIPWLQPRVRVGAPVGGRAVKGVLRMMG
jgi:hypothetical protein